MDPVGEGEPEFAEAGGGNPNRASAGQRDDGAGPRVPHQHHGISPGIPPELRLAGVHPGKPELRIPTPIRRDGAGRTEGPAPDREPGQVAAGLGIEREDEGKVALGPTGQVGYLRRVEPDGAEHAPVRGQQVEAVGTTRGKRIGLG